MLLDSGEMVHNDQQGEPPRTPKQEYIQKFIKEEDGCGNNLHQEATGLYTPTTTRRKSSILLEDDAQIGPVFDGPVGFKGVPITPERTPNKPSKGIKKSRKDSKSTRYASRPYMLSDSREKKTRKKIPTTGIKPSLGLQLCLVLEESEEETNNATGMHRTFSQSPDSRDALDNDTQMSGTPKNRIIDEELVNEWHGKSRKHEFSSSDDDVSDFENVHKDVIRNPFSSSKSPKRCSPTIRNPFVSAPFNLNTKVNIPSNPQVDYSSYAEYYNSKTDEKFIRGLSEEERRIKPKKLDFTSTMEERNTSSSQQETLLDSKNNESLAANKFLLNNLQRFMVDPKPKNSLGFEIFNDNKD